jgi:hypothetical protein
LGQLINGALKPLELATGGVIPAPCPGPHEPSHQKTGGGSGGGPAGGPPGPQQAAEAIKRDQAQAKARCKAVRYLATVPCHYYPEAEAALIIALRADRNECVRWEAARALGKGCCCTKKTLAALKLAVAGSNQDGHPAERSLRVRLEAFNALQSCLAMCGEGLPTPERPEAPETPPETLPTPTPRPLRPETPAEQDAQTPNHQVRFASYQAERYYSGIEQQGAYELLNEARQLLREVRLPPQPAGADRRGGSLWELWQRSAGTSRNAPSLPQRGERTEPAPSGTDERVELATYHQPFARPPSQATRLANTADLPATSASSSIAPVTPAWRPPPPLPRPASAQRTPWCPPTASPGELPPGLAPVPPATVPDFRSSWHRFGTRPATPELSDVPDSWLSADLASWQ